MIRYIYRLIFTLPFLLALAGCGPGSTSNEQEARKQAYARGEMHIQRGMELFNQYCANCHDFSDEGIGPNLAGITSKVDKEWIVRFINNPPEMIASGDERAVQLYEKYQQYMPPFSMIKGQDLEDILAFIHRFSEGEKRNKNNRPGGLINPIPEKMAYSNLTLVVEEQFIVPASSEIPPHTRINKMEPIPGGRVMLHDLRGKMYEVNANNNLSVYLDLNKEIPDFKDNPGKGSGLGSWAFHPEFEKNGIFYTTHTEPAGTKPADYALPDSLKMTLQFILLEWKADDPKAQFFSGTHREMLRVDMLSSVHTFQELTYNPLAKPGTSDYGILYLGVGDAGAALRGYFFLCEDNTSIWGKVLRLDPTGNNSRNGKYGIPSDNPFVGNPEVPGEIWASGFRNPHRISWDETGSGIMFITNIGEHSLEEVNVGVAGANYGWPFREGTFLFDANANPEFVYPLPENDEGLTYPVIQYDHDEGSAVSGGFVYSGTRIPALKGKYIFGDISRGMLYYTNVADIVEGEQAPIYRLNVSIGGKLSDMAEISGHQRVDLRIGKDQEGELYLMTKGNGGVYKIVDCIEDKPI